MSGHYAYTTRAGMFRIIPRDGRWHVMLGDEDLGRYFTPQQAAKDLAEGHRVSRNCGDTSLLDIPGDLSEWAFVSPPR